MAEVVASLTSALANLDSLSAEPSSDPRFAMTVASVSRKVFEAVSSLDDLSVTEWLKPRSGPRMNYTKVDLPTWWVCLDQ
jgi:hypothetical protein